MFVDRQAALTHLRATNINTLKGTFNAHQVQLKPRYISIRAMARHFLNHYENYLQHYTFRFQYLRVT